MLELRVGNPGRWGDQLRQFGSLASLLKPVRTGEGRLGTACTRTGSSSATVLVFTYVCRQARRHRFIWGGGGVGG